MTTPKPSATQADGVVANGFGGNDIIADVVVDLSTRAPATPAQISAVATWLPSKDADPNVWGSDMIATRWTGGVAGTIRAYWFQKVSDTAGYMDIPDPGGTLPITQIYRQAREMLEYWDAFIAKWGANADPSVVFGANSGGANQASVGKIKRRYVNYKGITPLDRWNYRTPYHRS